MRNGDAREADDSALAIANGHALSRGNPGDGGGLAPHPRADGRGYSYANGDAGAVAHAYEAPYALSYRVANPHP